MEAAREGDLVARHLCDDAARDLADLAVALLKRAGWTRRAMPVVMTGGVFKSSTSIRRAFARHLRRFAPAGARGNARTPARRRSALAGPRSGQEKILRNEPTGGSSLMRLHYAGSVAH